MSSDDFVASESSASDWPLLAPLTEHVGCDLRVVEVFQMREHGDNADLIRRKISERIERRIHLSRGEAFTPRLLISEPVVDVPNRLVELGSHGAVWRALEHAGVETEPSSRATHRCDGVDSKVHSATVGDLRILLKAVSEHNDCLGLLSHSTGSVIADTSSAQPVLSRVSHSSSAAWTWLYQNFRIDDAIVFPFGEFDDREVGLGFVSRGGLGDLSTI